MDKNEAIDYLTREYFCCCEYGTSIYNCGDPECKYGQAMRTLIKEASDDNQVGKDSTRHRG